MIEINEIEQAAVLGVLELQACDLTHAHIQGID